jgi:transcriptional regulator
MYQPPHFREDRTEVQHAFIRAYPLGLLITAGPGGLMANLAPFLIDEAGSGPAALRCHLARANPQLRELASVSECMVAFQGPQAYVSPSWYPSKRETGKVVPTWNYAAVHVWGRPSVIEDEAWLREQITALTVSQEEGRAAPWSVADAPPDFITAQLKGILGVAIPISRIEGKWKVSQNRPGRDRAGVAEGFRNEGDEAMAALVAERSGE